MRAGVRSASSPSSSAITPPTSNPPIAKRRRYLALAPETPPCEVTNGVTVASAEGPEHAVVRRLHPEAVDLRAEEVGREEPAGALDPRVGDRQPRRPGDRQAQHLEPGVLEIDALGRLVLGHARRADRPGRRAVALADRAGRGDHPVERDEAPARCAAPRRPRAAAARRSAPARPRSAPRRDRATTPPRRRGARRPRDRRARAAPRRGSPRRSRRRSRALRAAPGPGTAPRRCPPRSGAPASRS